MLENLYDIVERKVVESFISQLSDIFLFFGRVSKICSQEESDDPKTNDLSSEIEPGSTTKKKITKKEFSQMKMMYLTRLSSLDFLYKERYFMELFILLMEKYFNSRENNNEEYLFGLHFFKIIISNIHKSLLLENYECKF
jgi:hypothetical protein